MLLKGGEGEHPGRLRGLVCVVCVVCVRVRVCGHRGGGRGGRDREGGREGGRESIERHCVSVCLLMRMFCV